MLKIVITGIAPNGSLILEANGHPNNGHSTAKRRWVVSWELGANSGISSIEGITLKPISGNTDIFSKNPPRPLGSKSKWQAIVNDDAKDCATCVYNIEWVKNDSSETKVFDPIISIKPTTFGLMEFLFLPAAAFCAFTAMQFLLGNKKKSRWPF